MQKVIAIDCGGTNLRVAAVDENLNILAVKRVPTVHDDPAKLYLTMKKLIDDVAVEAMIDVVSIGLSMCGIVVHNHVGKVGNLGILNGFDFVTLFAHDYPNALLKIANDGNCSAFVEAKYGANKGLLDSAFITISTGIGLGIVHNGEMIDTPLEAGRLMTEYNGKLYETEALLSGNGLVTLCALNGIEIHSAKDFFDGVKAKDPKFIKVYNIWVGKLGVWLGNLQLLFDCQSYALSGGVMKSSDVFLEDLQRIANASIASWHLNPIILRDAKYRQDVGIAAAASLALHELELQNSR